MSLNLQLDEDSNDEQSASHEQSFSESNINSRFNSVVEPDLSDIEEEDFVPEKSPQSRALPDWMTIPSPTKKRKREDVETTSPKKRKIMPRYVHYYFWYISNISTALRKRKKFVSYRQRNHLKNQKTSQNDANHAK